MSLNTKMETTKIQITGHVETPPLEFRVEEMVRQLVCLLDEAETVTFIRHNSFVNVTIHKTTEAGGDTVTFRVKT